MRKITLRLSAVALAVALGPFALRAEEPDPGEIVSPVLSLTPQELQAKQEFEERLKGYIDLHKKLEATLPKLSKEATPEELDKNQRALGLLIKAERAAAKRGEFFSPGMEQLVRRTMKSVLSGRDAKTIKGSIMDENPGVPDLQVNDRYPDSIPLSTMPPQVLEPLPALTEDLEYRFIGQRLALVDSHAHIIVDFTNDVLP